MVLILSDDTLEEARSYAEEERRRQQEEEDRLAAIIAEQQRNAYPGVQVDPYRSTGWSYNGSAVAPDYVPDTRSWTSPESQAAMPDIGWNTPGSGNASLDALTNTPPPAANEWGTGFEGQQWYENPNYEPYTAPAPSPFVGAGFGATMDTGPDPVQAEIDRRRMLGEKFLPPGTEQMGRSNVFERAAGAVADRALPVSQAVTDWSAQGFYNFAGDVNAPAYKQIYGDEAPAYEDAYGPTKFGYQALGDVQNLIGAKAVTGTLQNAGRAGQIAAGANRLADVAQMKVAKPAIGAIGGYAANEAAGQPLEPWQAALGGAAAGVAAGPAFKGAKALGGELATGRLAGETGALDFTKRITADHPLGGQIAETLARNNVDFSYGPAGEFVITDPQLAARVADDLESTAMTRIAGTKVPGGLDKGTDPFTFGSPERAARDTQRRINAENRVGGPSKGDPFGILPGGDATDYRLLDDAERIREIATLGNVDPAKEAMRQPFAPNARLADFTPMTDAERAPLESLVETTAGKQSAAGRKASHQLGIDDADRFAAGLVTPEMNPANVPYAIYSEVEARGFDIGRVNLSVRERAYRNRLEEIAREVYTKGHASTVEAPASVVRSVPSAGPEQPGIQGVAGPEAPRPAIPEAPAPAASGVTPPPRDIEFSTNTTGWTPTQRDTTLFATDVQGNHLGRIDYSVADGEVHLNFVDVPPEMQRQGIATKLLDQLKVEEPGKPFVWGMQTPEGAALKAAYEGAPAAATPPPPPRVPPTGTPPPPKPPLRERLADETGAITLPSRPSTGTPPPVALSQSSDSALGGIAREAARVFGHAAVGSGIGASVGAYTSGGDRDAIIKGAIIGAGSGVAFRGVGAAAGKVAGRGMAERIAAREVAMGVPQAPASVSKLTTIIKAAKPVRAETETMKTQALARKAARLHGVYGSTSGEAAVRAAPGALTGDLPKAVFEAPRPAFEQTEIDGLFDHIVANPKVSGPNQRNIFQVFNTQNALTKVLAGELPTNGEIKLLETAFGEDLAKALLSKRSLGAKAWAVTMDAVNMPRTLKTSIDASAPLRQGAILAAGHPLRSLQSVGTMIRAMASPEFAKYADEGIELSPNAPLYERMKLYFAPSSMAGDVSGREEAFMSKLATKIPGVGGSQRGYTTYLNAVRQRVADDWLRTLTPAQKADDDMLQQMGNWLNVASGRGKLPPVGDRVLSISSGVLFAPRYAVSRIQVPWELLKALNPHSNMAGTVRKEIARDLVTFVGTGVAILELGKQSGWWDAETDPRSTDFGKIRMGGTRWDMWAGEQQIARTIAQIATRQRKSTSTGEIVPTDRSDTLLRWFRSKASPAAGFAWDVAEGKTFIGEEINADKSTLLNQSFQQFMPLFIQDVTEAWMEDGFKAAARSVPSGFGMGVQTYLSTRDIQNRVSQEKFGKAYLDLTKGERDTVKADPRVAEEIAKFNRAVDVNPSQFFDRKSEFNVNLEAKLRGQLDQGLNNSTLREAVSDLKGDRWVASEALLGGDAVQKALKSGTPLTQIADTLAEAYWSAPVKETVTPDGYIDLDFDSRDATRADVLSKAREAGIDPNYITGSGLGTFRGERFSDPKVKEAVEKVEAVQKKIEDSGYWDLKDKAWAAAVKQGIFDEAWVVPSAGMGYYDWIDAMTTRRAVFYTKRGDSPAMAKVQAKADVMSNIPEVEIFNDGYISAYRDPWIQKNPQVAKLVIEWGYDSDGFGEDINAWLAKR